MDSAAVRKHERLEPTDGRAVSVEEERGFSGEAQGPLLNGRRRTRPRTAALRRVRQRQGDLGVYAVDLESRTGVWGIRL